MKERVFINSNNIASFICPECQKVRTADVSRTIGIKSAVHVKCLCKCGNQFEAILERRKYFRKSINLKGTCYPGKDSLQFSVIVADISRSGLKLKLNANHDLKCDDELLIEFFLDDPENTLISKKIVIRSIDELSLGVEFKSPEHYDKLGSYLMFY